MSLVHVRWIAIFIPLRFPAIMEKGKRILERIWVEAEEGYVVAHRVQRIIAESIYAFEFN